MVRKHPGFDELRPSGARVEGSRVERAHNLLSYLAQSIKRESKASKNRIAAQTLVTEYVSSISGKSCLICRKNILTPLLLIDCFTQLWQHSLQLTLIQRS